MQVGGQTVKGAGNRLRDQAGKNTDNRTGREQGKWAGSEQNRQTINKAGNQ